MRLMSPTRIRRLVAGAAAVTLGVDLAAVALASQSGQRVAPPPAVSLDHHGQALIGGVGDWQDIRNAQDRIAARAESRDPSGRRGAGGRVVVHHAGGRRIRQGSAYALLHRTGTLGVEPTLGVLGDGSVFVQGVTRDPALRSVVLRTRDGGRTFTDVSPKVGGRYVHASTQDPYLYAEPRTGRVFTNDFVGCGLTSRSDDGGASWTTFPPLCSHLTDHQNLFGGPPVTSRPTGYPHVLYYCAVTLPALNTGTSAGCDKSVDGGTTFVPTGSLAFTPRLQYNDEGKLNTYCTGLIGHGTVGPDGTVYVPKTCSEPLLLVSRDEGLTWQTIAIPTKVGVNTDRYGRPDHESAVGVDAKGIVYYTWIGRDRLPYLVTSRDGGRTWSRPLMVGAPGVNETNIPALAVSPGGRVAISYMGSKTSPGAPFPNDSTCELFTGDTSCRSTTSDYLDTTWNGYITVTDDPLRARPTFTSVSINDEADPLTIGECGPFRCQQQYDFDDVQLGPDGTPWAVFSDGCDVDLFCESLGEAVVGRIAGLPRHR
ncbi:MAG TPA: sialidase family protein [Mycobacteriales bacterium]|nr:sialidase family protein [Mycobacteriales bacterium]